MTSIRVEQNPLLRGFQNIRNAVIPLIWFVEEAGLNDELAGQVKGQLMAPVAYANMGINGMAVGGWATLLATIIYRRCFRGGTKSQGLDPDRTSQGSQTKILVPAYHSPERRGPESGVEREGNSTPVPDYLALYKGEGKGLGIEQEQEPVPVS
jgi:hypothetical protein